MGETRKIRFTRRDGTPSELMVITVPVPGTEIAIDMVSFDGGTTWCLPRGAHIPIKLLAELEGQLPGGTIRLR